MKKASKDFKDLSIKEIVEDLRLMPRDKKFYKDLEKYKDFI